MKENLTEINDVYYLLKEGRMTGLTIKDAARELDTSTRTIFRMIQDGRLKAEKVDMLYGNEKYIWIIDPMSVARIQVRKEIELEEKNKKKAKEELIAEIRSEETKAKENYTWRTELAKEALPRLWELLSILNQMVTVNYRLNSANDHVEAGRRSLQESYGQTIEVEKPGNGLVYQVSAAGIGDYIIKLEGMLEPSPVVEDKTIKSTGKGKTT